MRTEETTNWQTLRCFQKYGSAGDDSEVYALFKPNQSIRRNSQRRTQDRSSSKISTTNSSNWASGALHTAGRITTVRMLAATAVEAGAWSSSAAASEDRPRESSLNSRSLASLLFNDHPRGVSEAYEPASEIVEEETELEGSSLFVEVDQNAVAPHFSSTWSAAETEATRQQVPASLINAEMKCDFTASSLSNSRKSNYELLWGLFPAGFTSSNARPLETATATAFQNQHEKGTSALLEADKEPELEGRQAWACLVPSTPTTTTTYIPARRKEAQVREKEHSLVTTTERGHLPAPTLISVLPQTIISELIRPPHDGSSDTDRASEAQPTDEFAAFSAFGIPKGGAARRRLGADNDSETRGGATVRVVEKRGEEELKLTLDHLVPKLFRSEERVKCLENRSQKAMDGETGQNALVNKSSDLEAEVKNLKKRIDEWRAKKQLLESENSHLGTKLHRALDRSERLESENRHKEVLLSEAREATCSLAQKIATLKAELCQSEKLLGEVERERERAWQTANVSSETVKAALRREEAVANEVESLRSEMRQRDANATPIIGHQRQIPSSSQVILTTGDSLVTKKFGWEAEQDLSEGIPVGQCLSRGRSYSERGRLSDCLRQPNRTSNSHGQQTSWREKNIINMSSLNPPSAVAIAATKPVLFSADFGYGNGNIPSPDSEAYRGEQTATTRESPWTGAVGNAHIQNTRGCKQRDIGDRQRYNSEGVKEALTAARSDWADDPSGDILNVTSGYGHFKHPLQVESQRVNIKGVYTSSRDGEEADQGDVWRSEVGRRNTTRSESEAEYDFVTDAPVEGWKPNQQFWLPAGHKKGRDSMSARHSNLSGAGVGVRSEIDTRAGQVLLLDHKAHDAGAFSGQPSKQGAVGMTEYCAHSAPASPTSKKTKDRRLGASTQTKKELGRSATTRSTSATSDTLTRSTVSLADLIRNNDPGVPERGIRVHRERETAPFATDAAEEELRPMQEVEKKLTLLQMEMSQLEAEQSKLVPKASKTMQARVQLRNIEHRLAWLAKESTGLRRSLREKSWPI